MLLSNKRNVKVINSLPDRRAKSAFFAGGKATTQQITQVEESALVHRYVGKVRGIVVRGPDDKFLFDTQAEAMAAALWFLQDCKSEASGEVLSE